MTRHVAAIVWSAQGLRVARGLWRAGRLESVRVERIATTDLTRLDPPLAPATCVAVVLPATDVGRRLLTLPFRAGRRLDELVVLETRGALPVDPGPLTVAWEPMPDAAPGTTRVATAFVRDATLADVTTALRAAGVAPLRIDAAPTPIWCLVEPSRRTAVLLRDTEGLWLTATSDDDRPLLARPLHAVPDDADAVAAEVARTLAHWAVRTERLVLAGPGADAYRSAIADRCGLAGDPLQAPEAAGDAPEDDPLLAGALLAAARRSELPLALLGPAVVPRRQRRRLVRLAVAACVLAVGYGLLTRLELAERAEALEAGIATVVAEVMPATSPPPVYADLEAAVEDRAAPPGGDAGIVRLHEVLAHLPDRTALDLRYLRLDPERVQVSGHVPTFDAVETLRRALAESPRIAEVSITEMRARLDGGGIEFRIDGRWLRAGERSS